MKFKISVRRKGYETSMFRDTLDEAVSMARSIATMEGFSSLTIRAMSKRDRGTYHRDLMRKRRANKVGSIEANLAIATEVDAANRRLANHPGYLIRATTADAERKPVHMMVCPRCDRYTMVATGATTVNCGDCLMNDTEIVEMRLADAATTPT